MTNALAAKLEALPTTDAPALAAGTASWAIEARGLKKSFRSGSHKVDVLKDIDLLIEPGEIALVMGPSGSGKSTLLAAVSGLLRPDEGSVTALGQNIWKMPNRVSTNSVWRIAVSSSRASTCFLH